MAELIITVSANGELTVRSEGMTRSQWEQATAELRGLLGKPTRRRSRASSTCTTSTLRVVDTCGVARTDRPTAVVRNPELGSSEDADLDAHAIVLGASEAADPMASAPSAAASAIWSGDVQGDKSGPHRCYFVRLYADRTAHCHCPISISEQSCAATRRTHASTSVER
jgi:hypothetical protein